MFPGWEETPPVKVFPFCAHCGRQTGDADGGNATYNGLDLCYPPQENRPNCYKLVAFEHHHIPCDHEGCWVGQQITEPDLVAEIERALDNPESLIRKGRPRRKE